MSAGLRKKALQGSRNIQLRRKASVLLPVDSALLSASAGSALSFL